MFHSRIPYFQNGNASIIQEAPYVDHDSGEWFEANSFLIDLDQRYPRLPITPSMLHAHAMMRGGAPIEGDPLHSAVYVHPSRAANNTTQRRYRMELLTREKSIEELKRTKVYWDPINNQQPPPPREPPLRSCDIDSAKQTTYAEHLLKTNPTVGMNHYSGDQIHQNWGLLKIGGRWTDPDSEYDLYRAIQLHDHGINLYTPPPRPLTRSPELVQTDTGPRIMTPEEEDEFYKGYVDEVTDDVDGEDDPRQYRIAPATFARWAAGCALGERYHEEPFPSVPKIPTPEPQEQDQIHAKTQIEPQFDVELGSSLSGIYELPAEPRVLKTPQGVDPVRPPLAYSYSYPKASLENERKAFAQYEQYTPYESTIESQPEVYRSEGGGRALGDLYQMPEAGEVLYNSAKSHLIDLRNSIHHQYKQIIYTAGHGNQRAAARAELAREVYFLNEKLNPQDRLPRTSPPRSQPIPYFANLTNTTNAPATNPSTPEPTTASMPINSPQGPRRQYLRQMTEETERQQTQAHESEPGPQSLDADYPTIEDEIEELRHEKDSMLQPKAKADSPRRPRRQYLRYIAEETQRQQILARKAELGLQALEADYQAIEDEIEGLQRKKAGLLWALGYETVDQIEDLMPKREPNYRDLRSQFKLSGQDGA